MIKRRNLPCCDKIGAIMEEKSNEFIDCDDIPVYYSSSIRAFYIITCSKKGKHIGSNNRPGYSIQFCPWCGNKFPKKLTDEKYAILNAQHQHNSVCVGDDSCFLPEFQTEEWWKKRGL